MLEQKIRIISENLARVVDRRQFVQKTGSTMFAGLIALAAGHGLARTASASGDTRKTRVPLVPLCSPIACPSTAMRRTIGAVSSVMCSSIRKKVARTLVSRSASSSGGVHCAFGPSSNVR